MQQKCPRVLFSDMTFHDFGGEEWRRKVKEELVDLKEGEPK